LKPNSVSDESDTTVVSSHGRINLDVDGRSRELLLELDRARSCSKPFMDTSVLHAMEQRYKTDILVVELEKELDRALLTQVFEREHLDRALHDEQRFLAEQEANAKEEARLADLGMRKDHMIHQMLKLRAAKVAQVLVKMKAAEHSEDEEDKRVLGSSGITAAEIVPYEPTKAVVKPNETETYKQRRQKRIAAIVGLASEAGSLNAGGKAPVVQFGLLHCVACNSMPCKWVPYRRLDALNVRMVRWLVCARGFRGLRVGVRRTG
jgi:hypothetical protein